MSGPISETGAVVLGEDYEPAPLVALWILLTVTRS